MYLPFASPIIKNINKKIIKNSKNKPILKELADVVTKEKIACGYNPDIKFFTMDNYDDSYGIQQINKLPMSLESAKAIKKGKMKY